MENRKYNNVVMLIAVFLSVLSLFSLIPGVLAVIGFPAHIIDFLWSMLVSVLLIAASALLMKTRIPAFVPMLFHLITVTVSQVFILYSLIKSDIGAQVLRFQGVRLLIIGLVLLITVCCGISSFNNGTAGKISSIAGIVLSILYIAIKIVTIESLLPYMGGSLSSLADLSHHGEQGEISYSVITNVSQILFIVTYVTIFIGNFIAISQNKEQE